jgi:hypothetical protein
MSWAPQTILSPSMGWNAPGANWSRFIAAGAGREHASIRACDKMIPMQNMLQSQSQSQPHSNREFNAKTGTFWPVSFVTTVWKSEI